MDGYVALVTSVRNEGRRWCPAPYGWYMPFKVTITTGPTSLITDEARAEYEELLELLRQDDIAGEITDRLPSGRRGVTWVEITEIWLMSTGANVVAQWAIEKVLDGVTGRTKQWLKSKRRREMEAYPDAKQRPQSVFIKNSYGEPERRIDVDSDGKVTEYHWVEIDKGEQIDESEPGP